MAKSKIISTVTETVTEKSTGEIIQNREVLTRRLPKEENFVKLYLNHITSLIGLPPSSAGVLLYIVREMPYTNEFVINPGIRKRIAIEVGIKSRTVSSVITSLVKKTLLVRVKDEQGIFMVNPMIFAKGNWSQIQEIQTTYTYRKNEMEISTKFKKKDEFQSSETNTNS